jgi:hypothetical protein
LGNYKKKNVKYRAEKFIQERKQNQWPKNIEPLTFEPDHICKDCTKPLSQHGYLKTFDGTPEWYLIGGMVRGGIIVCDGDWIISERGGGKDSPIYITKPITFKKEYEIDDEILTMHDASFQVTDTLTLE